MFSRTPEQRRTEAWRHVLQAKIELLSTPYSSDPAIQEMEDQILSTLTVVERLMTIRSQRP